MGSGKQNDILPTALAGLTAVLEASAASARAGCSYEVLGNDEL